MPGEHPPSGVALVNELRQMARFDTVTLHKGDSLLVRAADEIERLRAENAAFRAAIRTGEGPSCEDVCLIECIGVCGA